MAFDPLERSAYSGRPVELYEFWMADKYWRYTSSSKAITFQGYVYQPLAILRRTALKQDKDGGNDTVTLTVPFDCDLTWQFRIIVPARTIWMKIYRVHRGDTEFGLSFYGRVRGTSWKGTKANVQCDGMNSMFKRAGLRLNYNVKCPHMLYGPGCNLDKDQFRVDGRILSIGKNTIQVAEFASRPDGWLALGYVEFGRYYYFIERHVGDTIWTMEGIEYDRDEAPLTVTAYAGCDRSIDTCWDKFNNGLNSEANAWFPESNPFTTGV